MSWVQSEDYYKAEIAPLSRSAEGIISHMNDDHSDANTLYDKNLAKLPSSSEATMLGVDRYGITLKALTTDGPRMARVGFPNPLNSEDEARPAIIELLNLAKNRNVIPKEDMK